jgi:DNA-binding transcriptional LysR family regulator
MELENLKAFCHVAETGSLSAAARRNGITPASASSRLLTLEHEVDLMLLDRKRAQHKLTPAGQVLYHHAREILRLYEEVKAHLHNGAQTKSEK